MEVAEQKPIPSTFAFMSDVVFNDIECTYVALQSVHVDGGSGGGSSVVSCSSGRALTRNGTTAAMYI